MYFERIRFSYSLNINLMDKMIKGTETEKSLLKAFAGESQAKNRYTFFSEIAKKEGYEQIAGIFYETALQEEMHAKHFLTLDFGHSQQLDFARLVAHTRSSHRTADTADLTISLTENIPAFL